MTTRKKTPDILAELLGERPKAPEREPTDTATAQPVVEPVPKGSRPRTTKQSKQPNSRLTEPIEVDTASGEPAGPRGDGPAHFVGFRLGGQLDALPLDHVVRALRMVAVTPVPEAPPWVVGAINLHGRVIPVVDLRQRLGQPVREPHRDDRLLIVETVERTMALIVDKVTEVLEVPGHQVGSPPDPLSQSRPLAAVLRRDGDLILVLEVTRLLSTGWDGLVARGEGDDIGTQVGDSAAERPVIKETVPMEGDDLTGIKGIGKVYARRLQAAGIHTFAALAERTADEVATLLGVSKGRTPQVQGWIDQAAELGRQREKWGHSEQ